MRIRSVSIAAIAAIILAIYSCNSVHTQPVPHQSVLSWNNYIAPVGTVATFTINRGTVSGGPYPVVVKAGILGTATSYTDTPLSQNTFYCWTITVNLNDGRNSAPSPEFCGKTKPDVVDGVAGFAAIVQ